MWEKLGNAYSIFNRKWPEYDEAALVLDTIEIAVQVNGQVKFKLDISSELSAGEVEKLVRDDDRLTEVLAGRNIVKFIYVKGRLANIVAK
jgi:leucyl-tRNA synthetase